MSQQSRRKPLLPIAIACAVVEVGDFRSMILYTSTAVLMPF